MRRVNNFGLLEISSNVLRIKEAHEVGLGEPKTNRLSAVI